MICASIVGIFLVLLFSVGCIVGKRKLAEMKTEEENARMDQVYDIGTLTIPNFNKT